jgi:ribosomal protein S18 acetylase RimI-like enzyme
MAIAVSRYDPSKSYKGQKTFDCGHEVINNFVARTLKQQTQRNLSVAYVVTDDDDSFIGFCTLMAASIGRTELAATDPPSLPIAVPVTKLAMLGVANAHKGRGYGKALLLHAIDVVVRTAESVGSYGLYLEADNGAYDFYFKLSFVPLKERQTPDPTPMFLHVETARQALVDTAPQPR